MQDAELFVCAIALFQLLLRLARWPACGYALLLGLCHGLWFAARLQGRDCRVGWWPPALLCQK